MPVDFGFQGTFERPVQVGRQVLQVREGCTSATYLPDNLKDLLLGKFAGEPFAPKGEQGYRRSLEGGPTGAEQGEGIVDVGIAFSGDGG